ncbi:hypothetical protein GCM10028771_09790 [Nocardioides marmoraquaticus]
MRELVRLQLTMRPNVVVVGEAETGDAAVSLAAHLRPDLVILDVSMPGMDGLQALPRIRTATPSTRVMVISAHHNEVMEDQALEGGAVAYLVKPVRSRQLLAIVDYLTDEET